MLICKRSKRNKEKSRKDTEKMKQKNVDDGSYRERRR
jgi:hypothetical protein